MYYLAGNHLLPHTRSVSGAVLVSIYYIYIITCIYVCGPTIFYFNDRLTFSNIHGRTSHQIYRLFPRQVNQEFSCIMRTLLYLSEG